MESTDPGARQLLTLEIPAKLQANLFQAGYLTLNDVNDVRPSQLSQHAGITLEEAADVLEQVATVLQKPDPLATSKSAYDLLQEDLDLSPIITASQKLDEMLDGGIPLRKVTEVAGVAGTGKTQLCLQLCVNVQIPAAYGGPAGQAVYIETEGSFAVNRLMDMAEACVKHCKSTMGPVDGWSVESIAGNVFVYRCKELSDLISCVKILRDFLHTHKDVKLIVVDSLAFHFRHDIDSSSERSSLMHNLGAELTSIAHDFKLAVVVTNQMTTQFDSDGDGHLTPALGLSWAYIPSLRILLARDPARINRWATIIKSSYLPKREAPFEVTKEGIRDVAFVPSDSVIEEAAPGAGLKRKREDSSSLSEGH